MTAIRLVRGSEPALLDKLTAMDEASFGDLIKGVIDIDQRVMAIGASSTPMKNKL